MHLQKRHISMDTKQPRDCVDITANLRLYTLYHIHTYHIPRQPQFKSASKFINQCVSVSYIVDSSCQPVAWPVIGQSAPCLQKRKMQNIRKSREN